MKRFVCLAMSSMLFLQNYSIIYASVNNTSVESLKNINEESSMEIVLNNYVTFLTGSENINKSEDIKSKLDGIEKATQKAIDLYLGIKNPTQIFKGDIYDMSEEATIKATPPSSDSFNKTASLIKDIAVGYATSGTKFYKDEKLKIILQDSIETFYEVFSKYMTYNEGKNLFGNWWNFEIGVPIRMTDTLVLTKDIIEEKNPELLKNYVKCFDNYLRSGKNGDIDLTAPQHTGANLIDIAQNRILQGAIIKDSKRIQKAIKDMSTVFNTIDPYNLVNNNTDGVYEDGSFIQHHRVAYTGTYGKLLLQKAASFLYILNGTPWEMKDEIKIIENWVYNSFLPVMHEGFMMEMVKGRAVSRSTTGYEDSIGVIEAMTLISLYLQGDDKIKMQEQIKYLSTKTQLKVDVKKLNLIAISVYNEIINDDKIKAVNHIEKGAYPFNAMDRNVQIGDNFTFSLARSSNRIAKYEYMSGENLKPWFQGDGAFYLYLNGKNQTKHYGIDYMTTINPNRYPGTTTPNEERKTITELYDSQFYKGWASGSKEQNDYVYFPTSSNKFSTSVVLDDMTLAGMQLGDDLPYVAKNYGLLPKDFVVYKNCMANKSYFVTNDKIVNIGSNIYDELDRGVTTTIDNRMHDISDKIKIYGGSNVMNLKPLTSGVYYDLKLLIYENETENVKIGYYFPETKPINIEISNVSKNQREIRDVKTQKDNIITKGYTTITYKHTNEKDTYSYVIIPNITIEQAKKYEKNNDIKILTNNDDVHVIEDKANKVRAYNFFNKTTANEITSNDPLSLFVKEEEGFLKFAVSEPLFSKEKVSFVIDKKLSLILNNHNKRVNVSYEGEKTKVTIDTKQLYGKTVEFALK